MQERIVHFLKATPDYLSGEDISRTLNISRAAIWKHIEDLRAQGYQIQAAPRLGYRLMRSVDKLLPQELSYQLKTRALGRKIYYHERLSSTMDEAFELGRQGAAEGTLVCAEEQTRGRGRMGRGWVSPRRGGIYCSLILRPGVSLPEVAKLTLLSAVAVCETVIGAGAVESKIKWPNDILCGRRKLAGILTELSAETDRINFVVVGIGINVNTPAAEMPSEATSMKIQTKKAVSRVALTQQLLRNYERWYLPVAQEGFGPVLRRWKELAMTLGQKIRVEDSSGFIEGEAVDLAEDGGLLIRRKSGELIKRMSGDVVAVG